MFTGIIEEVGKIEKIEKKGNSASITIKCNKVLEGTKIGDSIAVNGICLTVTNISKNSYETDVMPETMRRSSLDNIKKGDPVNLERALKLEKRLGGHIVSGHIDGTGKIERIEKEANAIWYQISAKSDLMKYIVEKGSVAIDGISLTVAEVENLNFKVSIIPHTQKETNLGFKNKNDIVNIECDIIGKYIEKLVLPKNKESKLTEEFLIENGF